jgi:hypothetical protein
VFVTKDEMLAMSYEQVLKGGNVELLKSSVRDLL